MVSMSAFGSELPTLPGFDPGRALARPSGRFVLLREVTIRLRDDPERVIAIHGRLLVNRYDVEAVSAELMLGFYFPGAHLEVRSPTGEDEGALIEHTAEPVAAL